MATLTRPAADDSSPGRSETPDAKRIRLSLACNQCRKRKVKCDTETPKCRNCWLRDEICETTDPRYPERGPTERRWATKDGLLPGQNPAATHRNQAEVPRNGSVARPSRPPPTAAAAGWNVAPGGSAMTRRWSTTASRSAFTDASGQPRESISASPVETAASAPSATGGEGISWVSKGYQDSINAGGSGGEVNGDDSDPSLVVNADSSNAHRVKFMGGSSVQCLSTFVNIYLQRKGLPTVSSHFRSGMRHVEEFQLPLALIIPPLPDQQSLESYLDTFFTRIWPIFPVVDRRSVEGDIQFFRRPEFSSPGGLQANLTAAHIPQLVSVLLIVAIAADETACGPTELGGKYLDAAYGLFAHLVASPYLPSVQALVLLSVALRCRCKDGQAWHILAEAIRIAHSIGLHRYIRSQSRPASSFDRSTAGYGAESDVQARVWWSCYALEKLGEIETGRPSAINDEDIDQLIPSGSWGTEDAPDIFSLWVGLTRIISQINQHIYRKKPTSAWQLISEIGRLDQLLSEWANSLPDIIKPGHEPFAGRALGHGPYQQHISSFLSLQYYQAQITLLRASLVFPTQSFVDEVTRLGPRVPSYARLLQAENICVGSARATVRQLLELADCEVHSLLFSGTQLFLAAVVLALHVVKNPGKRLVRSDLELLVTSTEHLEAQFARGGQHPGFVRGFATLRTSVLAAAGTEQRQPPGALHLIRSTQPTPPADDPGAADLAAAVVVGQHDAEPLPFFGDVVLSHMMPEIPAEYMSFGFDDVPPEELWGGAAGSYSFLEQPRFGESLLQPR